MKSQKEHLVHHKLTNSTWANCKDWYEKWNNGTIEYGEVWADIDNFFDMMRYMKSGGYFHVKVDPVRMRQTPKYL